MKFLSVLAFIMIMLLGLLMVLTIFDYPRQYDCYQNECTEYNIDSFDSCKHLGVESTGFLSSEDFYLCDGVKIAKRCENSEEVKREGEPNMLDVLSRKCSSLKKGDHSNDQT